MNGAGSRGSDDAILPSLRPELRVLGLDEDRPTAGSVVFDPVRGRHYRIDAATAGLLSLWPECRTAEALAARAAAEFGTEAGLDEIAALSGFLKDNELIVPGTEAEWRHLAATERARQHGWLQWLIHNYLFLKIPLIAPMPLLRWLTPRLSWIYSRTMLAVMVGVAALGLYLVMRQWSGFLSTFSHLFSAQGALLFLMALAGVKSLHELGHAVTAVRYGCTVPSMGVCFMVLVPMLYSDASDAWRLADRKKRLAIDAAGIVVELGIAAIATLLWSFLPDGPGRSLAFALATTSWILSAMLNLNPFMRFDGYYILCDLTGIDNLQPRAFALGVWRMREILFGLGAPPPERFSVRTAAWLVAYAWATWVYRLVVFTGIAVLVYMMAFKLLGIALFLIEIAYFIALPVWREVKTWITMRGRIFASRRAAFVAGAAGVAAFLAVVPLPRRVAIPAIIEDAQLQQVFLKRAAVVSEVGAGRESRVAAGDLIVQFVSPELEHEIRITRRRIALVTWRLARLAADPQERAEALVLQDQLQSLTTRLSGLEREKAELKVVAETAGRLAEVEPGLMPGRFVKRSEPVALIAGGEQFRLMGYVSEEDAGVIDPSRPATFVPEAPFAKHVPVTITEVAPTGAAAIAVDDLVSHYGGAIAARPQERTGEGRLNIPVVGQFQIRGDVDEGPDFGAAHRVMRGTLMAKGRPESLAERVLRQVLKVLVRESGF